MDEKLADKVVRLTAELFRAKEEISTCRHDFLPPVPATKDISTPVFKRYEEHGSDPEPIYDWVKGKEYGWSRECKKCGYSEYTSKTKSIVTGNEPDFKEGMRK